MFGGLGLLCLALALATGFWNPWRGGRLQGIDVSHHQGPIDWAAVASDDVAFAYIKASEGGDFVDPRFGSNWEASARAGVPRGAYHFFTLCRSGEAQAANFIRVVPREPEALPHALDLEHMGPCQSRPTLEDVVAEASVFLDRLEAHYGRRPLVYTTERFHTRHLTQMEGETFWLRSMLTPPGFREAAWKLWQHSGSGRIRGVEGEVDLNLFRGDAAAFQAWAQNPERGPDADP